MDLPLSPGELWTYALRHLTHMLLRASISNPLLTKAGLNFPNCQIWWSVLEVPKIAFTPANTRTDLMSGFFPHCKKPFSFQRHWQFRNSNVTSPPWNIVQPQREPHSLCRKPLRPRSSTPKLLKPCILIHKTSIFNSLPSASMFYWTIFTPSPSLCTLRKPNVPVEYLATINPTCWKP